MSIATEKIHQLLLSGEENAQIALQLLHIQH